MVYVEIVDFCNAIERQIQNAEKVREASIDVPEFSESIGKWLNKRVYPALYKARRTAIILKDDIEKLPQVDYVNLEFVKTHTNLI